MSSDSPTPAPAPQTYTLLTLPPEIRSQIFTPLLTPHPTSYRITNTSHNYSLLNLNPLVGETLRISPLFIRTNYAMRFMTQTSALKHICTNLLRVNWQISEECLPILYSKPLWRASCRLEALASQIGMHNVARIRRMEVDLDDLEGVLGSLRVDILERRESGGQSIGIASPLLTRELRPRLRFSWLERLDIDGWQRSALTGLGDMKSRLEARRLCLLAKEVLTLHPLLGILVQLNVRGGLGRTGGADARDMSMGRVKWRFLRDERDMMKSCEHLVDLDAMIGLLNEIMDIEVGAAPRAEKMESWHGGVYRQYPYLSQG